MKAFILNCLVLAYHVHAFDHKVYREITEDVLKATTVQVNFTGTISFSGDAVKDISKRVRTVDRTIAGRRNINADWHFYNERFADASERLVLLKDQVVTAVSGSSPDPELARELFGSALNTLQDFYSHTNWVELGNTEIDPRLGRELLEDGDPSLQTCSGSSLVSGLTELTSGWMHCRFNRKPDNKCCSDDLNKDNSDSSNFGLARDLAKNATADYLGQLVEDLRALDDEEASLRRFLGRDTAVIFVIDTTESMKDELEGVKSKAASIVGDFNNSQTGRYILISFADGSSPIRSVSSTPNPEQFLEDVNALEADSDGGGDCREGGWEALDRAIDEAVLDSNIFFWSDASHRATRNRFLFPFSKVWRRIKSCLTKHTHIDFVLTGHCLPFGTSYDEGFGLFAAAIGASIYTPSADQVEDVYFDD